MNASGHWGPWGAGLWAPRLRPFPCLYRDRVGGPAPYAVVTFGKKFPRQNQVRFHVFARFQGEGDGERGQGTARVASNSRGCQRDLLTNVGGEARGRGIPNAHRRVSAPSKKAVGLPLPMSPFSSGLDPLKVSWAHGCLE